jgi:hypothetical protein
MQLRKLESSCNSFQSSQVHFLENYFVKRFHIVVANFEQITNFVDNFKNIHGFDPDQDSIYILDSSQESAVQSEMVRANRLCSHGLEWEKNLFFIKRRNWGVNHGAQLDYFRAVLEGMIQPPQLVAFMQEHYLDLDIFVKEDTLPKDAVYDLNQIAHKFEDDQQIGCGFHSRYGIRVSISNPVTDDVKEFFGDGDKLLDKAVRRSFLIDGGNFVVRPELYLRWFAAHRKYLIAGDGSYGFSHVWEARLGQILYDQNIKWCDFYRELEYTTISDLDEIERESGRKVSKLWYDHRIWYFFYGRDLKSYWPLPLRSFIKYFRIYLLNQIMYPRDTTLTFVKP